ncbi:MAG: purine-nucleoside phosphorylase [Oligoflexia bacterium]|nr:purine-nucleoside phosphorylase [Oligoflexia bacterium]
MILNNLIESVKYIQDKISEVPKTAVVLGSGLGLFADKIEDKVVIPYAEIPHFFGTTVKGHKGQFVCGKIDGTPVIAMQGRIHRYEGHEQYEVVHPVRTLAKLGVENIILTNASGGINEAYKPGELVIIEDHINLTGNNPLLGPNIEEFGPRFPDMSETYNKEIITFIKKAAKDLGTDIKTGIYAGVLGPTYETPAEVRMLKTVGGDMVGMSTVPEAIAANHMGVKLGGISCITNMAAGIEKGKLSHDDIKDQANKAMEFFVNLLTKTVGYLNS